MPDEELLRTAADAGAAAPRPPASWGTAALLALGAATGGALVAALSFGLLPVLLLPVGAVAALVLEGVRWGRAVPRLQVDDPRAAAFGTPVQRAALLLHAALAVGLVVLVTVALARHELDIVLYAGVMGICAGAVVLDLVWVAPRTTAAAERSALAFGPAGPRRLVVAARAAAVVVQILSTLVPVALLVVFLTGPNPI